MLHEWRDLQIKRGMSVRSDRTRSSNEKVIEILYRQ